MLSSCFLKSFVPQLEIGVLYSGYAELWLGIGIEIIVVSYSK